MNIYLIRHGKCDYSHIAQTENCSVANLAPLSEEGRNQAIAIRSYVKQLYQPIICSSPYTRTLQTAFLASESENILIDYRLHEWLPDKNLHCNVKEIAERNQYFKTNTQNVNYETKNEMHARFRSAVDDLIELQKKKRNKPSIVIFSHARVIASFLETECGQEIYLKNCQIAEVVYERNKFRLNRII